MFNEATYWAWARDKDTVPAYRCFIYDHPDSRRVAEAKERWAALDFEHVLGCAVNFKFHPTAIGKDGAARQKWIALLRTYFAMGGSQIQPTVASAVTLRAAQQDPDSYRDLIVKVGGYSTYFVDLGREIQAEVIERTEHSETN